MLAWSRYLESRVNGAGEPFTQWLHGMNVQEQVL